MANKGMANKVVVNQEAIMKTCTAFGRYVGDNYERVQELRRIIKNLLECGMTGGQAEAIAESLTAVEKKLAGFQVDMQKIQQVINEKLMKAVDINRDKHGAAAAAEKVQSIKTDKQITRK